MSSQESLISDESLNQAMLEAEKEDSDDGCLKLRVDKEGYLITDKRVMDKGPIHSCVKKFFSKPMESFYEEKEPLNVKENESVDGCVTSTPIKKSKITFDLFMECKKANCECECEGDVCRNPAYSGQHCNVVEVKATTSSTRGGLEHLPAAYAVSKTKSRRKRLSPRRVVKKNLQKKLVFEPLPTFEPAVGSAPVITSEKHVGASTSDKSGKCKRRKPGTLFFITLSLITGWFESVRSEFINIIKLYVDWNNNEIISYVVAVEQSFESANCRHHLHCFVELLVPVFLDEFRQYLADSFPDERLDIQSCKSGKGGFFVKVPEIESLRGGKVGGESLFRDFGGRSGGLIEPALGGRLSGECSGLCCRGLLQHENATTLLLLLLLLPLLSKFFTSISLILPFTI